MNCPRNNGKESIPIPAATVIKHPILFVTFINWSIHSMLLAYIGAIPTPMKAVKILNVSTDVCPSMANKVLPTTLRMKLTINVPDGLNLTATNIARNLIVVNDPQNMAVILAPIFRERLSLDWTENVARYVPYRTSIPA